MDVHALNFESVAARKDHEFVDEARDPVHFMHDQFRDLTSAFVRGIHSDQLGRASDAAEWVLDFVRDARGDMSVGFLAFPFAHLFTERARRTAISKRDCDSRGGGAVLAKNRNRDIDRNGLRESAWKIDFIMNRGPARAPDAIHDFTEWVVWVEAGDERLASRNLSRGIEEPYGLGVQEIDSARLVEDDNAFEKRIENAL